MRRTSVRHVTFRRALTLFSSRCSRRRRRRPELQALSSLAVRRHITSMSYAQQSSGSGSASGLSSHDQLSSTYAAATAEPGPYTAPSSSNVASSSKTGHGQKTSSMTKRQQAAHRARILAVGLAGMKSEKPRSSFNFHSHQLSKQLATRLQYGMFKVEHGWVGFLSVPLHRYKD